MRFLLITLFALLFGQAFSADKLSKEEKKRLKKELSNYRKHPEQYKSLITNYKSTIDTNENQLNTQKRDLIDAATKQVELEQQIAKLKTDLDACTSKPEPKCPDCPTPGKLPSTGTFYKVQFGLYQKFSITGYLDSPKLMGYENVEGMNRYTLSYFDNEEHAEQFVKDIRKMGIRDAFVAKYVDGQRIMEWEKNPKFKGKAAPASIQEAIEKK